MDNINFYDGVKVLEPYKQQIADAVIKSVEEGTHINGPMVAQFEREFAEYTGSKHAIGVSSGTDGLLAIILALELPPKSDILVNSYTFIASAEAIISAGHNPVFVDCAEDSFHPTVDQFKQAWTSKTRAVMFVHLFGETAPVDDLQELCNIKNAKLIEDTAESFGSYYPSGEHAGTKSIASSFSFFPAKTLGCMGDGGMVITDNDNIAEKIRMIRAHGSRKRYYHECVGGNMRLDTIQAKILSILLNNAADSWLTARRTNAEYFFKNIKNRAVKLPTKVGGMEKHSWYLFSLLSDRRDELKHFLEENGIQVFVYWPSPMHKQPVFVNMYGEIDLPYSELLCETVLHIPIGPHLTEHNLKNIVDIINKFQ